MHSLFIFTDEYRLVISIARAALLIATAIGLTFWAINLHSRTINYRQRSIITYYFLTLSFILIALLIDILWPDVRYTYSYPAIMSLAILLANIFLLAIIVAYVDANFYKTIQRLTLSLSLLIVIFMMTSPLHRIIDPAKPLTNSQAHWLINIFIYYGIACLLIAFFMYFSFYQRKREWLNGVIALIGTALLIIFIGYSINRLYDWDLFFFIYMIIGYYVLIFTLIYQSQRGPLYLKHLPVFERADIMMSIVSHDGSVRYASHGIARQIEIINELDRDIILKADGKLHVLDKDDAVYQWSSNPVVSNYLITIEDITDIMSELREKEKQRDELERQQILMGTQSSIVHEIERIQYRLQLLADVETETKGAVEALKNIIEKLSGPVTPMSILLVKLLARYIKRRSLMMLENDQTYSSDWISLVAQELLEVSFETNYAVHINPELKLNLEQLKLFQDRVADVALLFPQQIELLLSVRHITNEPEMTFLFRSSDSDTWRHQIRSLFHEQKITEDEDSMNIIIGLRG